MMISATPRVGASAARGAAQRAPAPRMARAVQPALRLPVVSAVGDRDIGDKAADAVDDAKRAASRTADKVSDAAGRAVENAKEAASDAKDNVQDTAGEVKSNVKGAASDAKQATRDASDKAKDVSSDVDYINREVNEPKSMETVTRSSGNIVEGEEYKGPQPGWMDLVHPEQTVQKEYERIDQAKADGRKDISGGARLGDIRN